MSRKGQKPEEQEAVSLMGARQEAKERIFANPQTGDEAEPDLPPLEKLANGYNPTTQTDGEHKIMTREEILNNGTPLQKIRLLVSNIDLNGYFEAKEELTKEERMKIINSIKTNEDRKLLEVCIKEYDTISNFGRLLSFFFKRFQTSYAILAVLLNKWDSYEYTAQRLTKMYEVMKTLRFTVWDEDEEGNPKNLQDVEVYEDNTINNVANEILYSNLLSDAALKFDHKTKCFYIDTNIKGDLFSQILTEAKSATKDLSDFKAYTIVAENFIKKSTLKYMPISIQQSIENAEEERYARYLVKNLRYFRSELNQRKARGEDITPQENKMAIIPDFYEVKPSKNVLADCKASIKDM